MHHFFVVLVEFLRLHYLLVRSLSLLWMQFLEYLARCLAKFANVNFVGFALVRVLNCVEVDVAFVRVGMIKIVVLN